MKQLKNRNPLNGNILKKIFEKDEELAIELLKTFYADEKTTGAIDNVIPKKSRKKTYIEGKIKEASVLQFTSNTKTEYNIVNTKIIFIPEYLCDLTINLTSLQYVLKSSKNRAPENIYTNIILFLLPDSDDEEEKNNNDDENCTQKTRELAKMISEYDEEDEKENEYDNNFLLSVVEISNWDTSNKTFDELTNQEQWLKFMKNPYSIDVDSIKNSYTKKKINKLLEYLSEFIDE